MNEEWLEQIEPGDIVIVSALWNSSLRKVNRLTKTQIILDNGARYRRKDGWRVGKPGQNCNRLVEPTDRLIRDIQHQEAVKKLDSVKWETYPLETLQKVMEML